MSTFAQISVRNADSQPLVLESPSRSDVKISVQSGDRNLEISSSSTGNTTPTDTVLVPNP
ncbi:MAG: hypothetical protein AAFO84_04560 [Cyanobacteria bacterium J06598_1]